jgi:hypothetical protein
MNQNNPLAKNPVIPAKAGIQTIKKSPAKRDNIEVLSASRAFVFAGFRHSPE